MFAFSFKNYRQKPYTTFLQKVEFFTRNPTKLDLHFSDFLRFLMFFQSFREKPKSFLHPGPWNKFSILCICPWYTKNTLE
jgi:hypothetical protein